MHYGIMSIPTVAFFAPGQPPRAAVGFRPAEQLEAAFSLDSTAPAAEPPAETPPAPDRTAEPTTPVPPRSGRFAVRHTALRPSHARRSAAPRRWRGPPRRHRRGSRWPLPAGGGRRWRPCGGRPGPLPGAAADHRIHVTIDAVATSLEPDTPEGQVYYSGIVRRPGRCVEHRGLVRRSVHRRPRPDGRRRLHRHRGDLRPRDLLSGRATHTPSPSTWSIPAGPALAICASVAWPHSRCGPSARRASRVAACGWSCPRATRRRPGQRHERGRAAGGGVLLSPARRPPRLLRLRLGGATRRLRQQDDEPGRPRHVPSCSSAPGTTIRRGTSR